MCWSVRERMRKPGGPSSVEMGRIWRMKEEDEDGEETASLVARNLRVIWDHPGSWGVGGGVYVRISTCVSWGWGQAGRQAQRKHLLWTPRLA